jgi:hypothetical protein
MISPWLVRVSSIHRCVTVELRWWVVCWVGGGSVCSYWAIPLACVGSNYAMCIDLNLLILMLSRAALPNTTCWLTRCDLICTLSCSITSRDWTTQKYSMVFTGQRMIFFLRRLRVCKSFDIQMLDFITESRILGCIARSVPWWFELKNSIFMGFSWSQEDGCVRSSSSASCAAAKRGLPITTLGHEPASRVAISENL